MPVQLCFQPHNSCIMVLQLVVVPIKVVIDSVFHFSTFGFMDKASLLKPPVRSPLLELAALHFLATKNTYTIKAISRPINVPMTAKASCNSCIRVSMGMRPPCSTHNSSRPLGAAGGYPLAIHSHQLAAALVGPAICHQSSRHCRCRGGSRLSVPPNLDTDGNRSSTHSNSTLSVLSIFPPVSHRIQHLCGQQPEP